MSKVVFWFLVVDELLQAIRHFWLLDSLLGYELIWQNAAFMSLLNWIHAAPALCFLVKRVFVPLFTRFQRFFRKCVAASMIFLTSGLSFNLGAYDFNLVFVGVFHAACRPSSFIAFMVLNTPQIWPPIVWGAIGLDWSHSASFRIEFLLLHSRHSYCLALSYKTCCFLFLLLERLQLLVRAGDFAQKIWKSCSWILLEFWVHRIRGIIWDPWRIREVKAALFLLIVVPILKKPSYRKCISEVFETFKAVWGAREVLVEAFVLEGLTLWVVWKRIGSFGFTFLIVFLNFLRFSSFVLV